MPDGYVDLHAHSTASDGTHSPAEVVRLAKQNGLSALALTDHDTVAGISEAASAAQAIGIDFLPGIEISCGYPSPGTMHLLGYGIDPTSSVLKDLTRRLVEARDQRNPQIIRKLNEHGVAITLAEVEAEAGGEVIGRPHFAAVLVRKGCVSSIKSAFDKYLAHGAAAFVDKERLTKEQALDSIERSGGITVLAHPFQLRTSNDAELRRVVKDLVDLGLAGIEVLHSDHDDAAVAKYAQIARDYGLIETGGSDFHGQNKSTIQLGYVRGRRVGYQPYEQLLERLARPRQSQS
jgi:3',5'-nucleoside bisphosphate phosphatase